MKIIITKKWLQQQLAKGNDSSVGASSTKSKWEAKLLKLSS